MWEQFKFWAIDYAVQYVQRIGWQLGIEFAILGTDSAIGANSLLWLFALIGFVTVLREISIESRRIDDKSREIFQGRSYPNWFVCGYFVFSVLCVIPGLLFRSHYYVVALPPLSILGGLGCQSLARLILAMSRKMRRNPSRVLADIPKIGQLDPKLAMDVSGANAGEVKPSTRPVEQCNTCFVSVVLLALAVIPTVLLQSDEFFLLSPTMTCRKFYSINPFPESPKIAAYLREHTEPTDTIAVLGSEPQLYFLSERRSSTGYIYMYPLMESQPFARQMQEDMIHEIERASPAYVVDVVLPLSWLWMNNGENKVFDWKKEYLERFYTCVGIVDIFPNKDSVFRWDRDAQGSTPNSKYTILVFKRA